MTGLGSFCHITFYAIGAYTSAILTLKLGLPFGIGFFTGGLMAAGTAALLAWPTVRTRGPYFFITTFAFWAVMNVVFKHWDSVTQGTLGISNIPPIMGFTSVVPYYYIALIFAAVTIFIMYRLDRSRFGSELLALGDADDLAEVVGINVVRHRVLAFAIGAFFAGLAGSIYAHYIRFISPTTFGLWSTIYIVIWVVLGGERKVWGPIAGAASLTLVAELLRMSGVLQALLYAAALLIAVMTMPHGIAGLIDTRRARCAIKQPVETVNSERPNWRYWAARFFGKR